MYSIIIPIYNLGNYIDDAINSVLQQDYDNWELILVDDGSFDNSREKCEKYVSINSHIRYYYQDNKGVSSARNKGINLSKGDYITFIDGDDYWSKTDVLSRINHLLNKQNDLLCSVTTKYNILRQNSEEYEVAISDGTRLLDDEIDIKNSSEVIKYLVNRKWSSWLFFVKREIVIDEKLYFKENTFLAEDADWVFRLLLTIDKVTLFKYPYYEYRIRKGSAMTKVNSKTISSYLEVLKYWIEYLEKNPGQSEKMITNALVSNCAEYLTYVFEFDKEYRTKWQEYFVKYRAYKYVKGLKTIWWTLFRSNIVFNVYIYTSMLRRKIPQFVRELIGKKVK